MDLIEVILLNYRFKFRRLFWKEEFDIKAGDRDERRVILATALVEVSGLQISSFDEAYRVILAIPTPILYRVFLIYKGKQPESRRFTSKNLYKAPEPTAFGTRIAEADAALDEKVDPVIKRMEDQFGKQEVAEAAEVERQIVAGSKYRGAVRRKAMDAEDEAPLGAFKVKPDA